MGARRFDLVRPVGRLALMAVMLFTGACSLVFALGGPFIARQFSDGASLQILAAQLLVLAAGFLVFDGALTVAKGALRGTGDVRYPTVARAIVAWTMTPPAMWLLGYLLDMGAVGGWIGISADASSLRAYSGRDCSAPAGINPLSAHEKSAKPTTVLHRQMDRILTPNHPPKQGKDAAPNRLEIIGNLVALEWRRHRSRRSRC